MGIRSEYTSLHTSGSKTCHATPLLPAVRGSVCLQQSVHLERAALLRHSETLHMERRRAAIYAKALCTQTCCSASYKGSGCDGSWLLLPSGVGARPSGCTTGTVAPQTKPELTAEKEHAPFDLLIGAACSWGAVSCPAGQTNTCSLVHTDTHLSASDTLHLRAVQHHT